MRGKTTDSTFSTTEEKTKKHPVRMKQISFWKKTACCTLLRSKCREIPGHQWDPRILSLTEFLTGNAVWESSFA